MSTHETARSDNFSAAFEQMCFVAIASKESPDDVLRQLILHCFVVLPEDQFDSANRLIEAIEVLFGLKVPLYQVQTAVDRLEGEGQIKRPLGTNYVLTPKVKKRLEQRIETAKSLEDTVKQEWFGELEVAYPTLPQDQMWTALRKYLAKSFRRHGIQAAALLDPSIEARSDHSKSLSALLEDALADVFKGDQEPIALARKAISLFFTSIGDSPDRATYIAQLADGAFSYFTLTVDPETARTFRENLQSLALFLDTNFLFAILDLSFNPLVEVSNEVHSVIQKFGLPFTLYYHDRTAREFSSTVSYYGDRLRARHWSQNLSRAAISSSSLSGIEVKYHQRNAESSTSVDAFLRPYEHADVLLKNKGISVHRGISNRLQERADLLHDYTAYLKARKRFKPDSIIDHDVTVLDAVRQRRSTAPSTLDAGALLLTCDYFLYRFDWEQSRTKGQMACVVLPNLFMQILRPFIPSTPDFDRSFAETFAIPEFRTVGSSASEATSKLLNLMAGYAEFSEETAVRLLSNDLLLDQLKASKDSAEFERQVELAVANENAILLEEMAALRQQLDQTERERETVESEKTETQQALRETHESLSNAKQQIADVTVKAQGESIARGRAEQKADRYARALATLLALLSMGAFFVVIYLFKWQWLLNHSNSYGLQGSAGLFIFLLVFGLTYPSWRKAAWGGAFSVVLVILYLLGGNR